jgi:hypothetical protein
LPRFKGGRLSRHAIVVTGAGLGSGPANSIAKPPAAIAARPCPRGRMLQVLATGSQKYSVSRRLTFSRPATPRRTGSNEHEGSLVQFPNLPLIVAFLAGEAGKFAGGSAHSYTASVSYLAMTIWAYEELAHGANWFRRLLGLT